MIKKTVSTLKQHPLTLLAFIIPFVYTAINYTVFWGSTFSDVMYGTAQSGIMSALSSVFTLIYSVGWGIFLFPSIMYYIYELAAGMPTEGWYSRGLKKCWWRNLVFGLVVGLISGVASMVFFIPGMIVFVMLHSYAVLYVMAALIIVFMIIFVDIMFTGQAAIFAENDFGKGLSAMFTAGFKNFWRVLPWVFIYLVPFSLIFIPIYNGFSENHLWILIASSFAMSLAAAFIYVYTMHCYVEWKNNAGVDETAPQAQEESA